MERKNWRRYFDFSSIDKNRTNGLCKLCRRNYKDKSGVFSNFLKHLKTQHRFEFNQLSSSEHDYLADEDNDNEEDEQTTDLMNTKNKENRITLSLAKNLIIRCNLPLNLVEKPAFREFMKDCHLKYRPISTKRLKHDVIPSLSKTVLARIHETLNATDYVTLTVDIWSDRRCRAFLGVTCHFIDEKMYPQAYLIDFIRFKSSHSSENIQQMTEETLKRFNLTKKVFRIITDNASSMMKAYKFGLSLEDENLSEAQDDEQHQFISDVEETLESSGSSTLNEKITASDKVEDASSIRLSCFAHTLQLCIRDGLRDVSHISKLLEKCQRLAKLSSQSSRIADMLEELNKHIARTNMTRWNSEYMLMKSILAVGKTDLDLILNLMDDPITFFTNDFTILEEMIDILEPFYEISIKCQGDTIVTVSLVVPAIVHCISHLRDIKTKLSFCTKLAEQLQASIDERFSGIIHRLHLMEVDRNEPFSDPLYFIATVLDPSFSFFWIRDLHLSLSIENRLKQHIIQLIVDDISDQPTETSLEGASKALPTVIVSSKPKKKRLFAYNERDEELGKPAAFGPLVELEGYLNDPIKARFSEYWATSRLVSLKKLVTRIFSVQASSASVERVFSHAGLILSSRRTNMSEHLFKDLLFLKVNQTLL